MLGDSGTGIASACESPRALVRSGPVAGSSAGDDLPGTPRSAESAETTRSNPVQPVNLASNNGQPRTLPNSVVETFRRGLEGDLMRPEDRGYNIARRVWNGMIVHCASGEDVARTVDLAREHGLLLSIRGGGHNVAGSSVAEKGLVIDPSRMRAVLVEPKNKIARVQGGAKLGDLDATTAPFGLAAPVGVVSATGVAGLTLHGGAGWLMRRHGLSIDNLLSVEMVTADGCLRVVSQERDPDLFWAVRGGGGNFGVVTSFEFAVNPIRSGSLDDRAHLPPGTSTKGRRWRTGLRRPGQRSAHGLAGPLERPRGS